MLFRSNSLAISIPSFKICLARRSRDFTVFVGSSPIYAEEQHDDTFPIPTDFIGKGEYFWLRAKGDSMINAGIDSGDLVLIRKQNTANEGNIVVALIDDSATLKTLSYDRANRKVVLKAENDDKKNYPNQIYDNIIIQGVAEHVLKRISRR